MMGGPMSDWRLWVAVLICAIPIMARIEGAVVRYLKWRKLKSAGRTIEASQALELFNHGLAAIVLSVSTFPAFWLRKVWVLPEPALT
jgi:hypothetical protein